MQITCVVQFLFSLKSGTNRNSVIQDEPADEFYGDI